MMKLKSFITSNSVKLIEIYNKINSGALVTSPDFQRNLVWKKQHKYAFINTILLNFPFPEVYIASTEVDVETLQAREIVVDGQQRLTTIVDYIKGSGDFKNQKLVTPFDDLDLDDKREFLNYPITVKDLKDIGLGNIKEIFKRINSTNYVLNSNENINAQYGDGEFSIFCKQIVDKDFEISIEKTDILLSKETRVKFYDFFSENKIFSDNDIKRMFDIQYLMLLSSTILEGNYFGRSTKINEYLKKYNLSFDAHEKVLKYLTNSIDAIEKLKLSIDSYWFNKANLFTLIIELSKIDLNTIDYQKLERELVNLENKMELYFSADNEEDIQDISEEEKNYFRDARQGSHEKASREHRGTLIAKILKESFIKQEIEDSLEDKNIKLLEERGITYAIIIPTKTGLNKNIMDAVSKVREFLKDDGLHNYEEQKLGPDHKIKLPCAFIISLQKSETSEVSLYRSNGRGDYRIWFSNLKDFADPNNELALIKKDGILSVLNLSKIDYSTIL